MEKKRLVLLLTLSTGFCAAGALGAKEATYTGDVRPLVEKFCVGCHGANSPEYPAFKKEAAKWTAEGKGPRMDTYAHLVYFTAWPDTGALMRRLDDGKGNKDGKPGNMYVHLGSTEEERQKNLGLFKGWVGNWTLKRWPEMTKDDVTAITVKY